MDSLSSLPQSQKIFSLCTTYLSLLLAKPMFCKENMNESRKYFNCRTQPQPVVAVVSATESDAKWEPENRESGLTFSGSVHFLTWRCCCISCSHASFFLFSSPSAVSISSSFSRAISASACCCCSISCWSVKFHLPNWWQTTQWTKWYMKRIIHWTADMKSSDAMVLAVMNTISAIGESLLTSLFTILLISIWLT